MGYCRLGLRANYLSVEVIDASCCRVAQLEGPGLVEGLAGEQVKEGAILAEVGDEPQLHLKPDILFVSCYESEDVGMAQEASLVHLYLATPRRLLLYVEYLDGHVFSLVNSFQDLAETTLADKIMQHDLTGNGLLHEQRLS